jgi:dienelactone hydrolase
MSETRQPFRLDTAAGRRLDGFLDLPDTSEPRPAVLVCHGFKGFMEWGFFPHLGELLARRGFVAVRFNFSGSGMRPGEDRAGDLDGFRANTYSRELEDLEAVLGAVLEPGAHGGIPGLDPARCAPGGIGLFGHSRGGGIALLGAAGRFRAQVRALVTWAAVAGFDRWGDEIKAEWRRRGEIVVPNARTGQQMPLGVGLLDDVEQNREALDLEAAAARRTAPWLLVHGRGDESVPWQEAVRLDRAAAGEHELLLVEGAGHTFGARHPFAGPTPHLVEALNATQTWLRRYLG